MIANMDKLRTNRLKVKLHNVLEAKYSQGRDIFSCLEYSKHLQTVSAFPWTTYKIIGMPSWEGTEKVTKMCFQSTKRLRNLFGFMENMLISGPVGGVEWGWGGGLPNNSNCVKG